MSQVEYLHVGLDDIAGIKLTCVPWAEPFAASLYQRRLAAMRIATAPYVCFLDGGNDRLLPGFQSSMEALAERGKQIGYANECIWGEERHPMPFTFEAFIADHSIIHHGVVCRRDALLAIEWPAAGCYSWEVIAYGTLAQQGYVYDPIPRYDWHPGPEGARLWGDYGRAVVNSKRFLRGLPGCHFKRDLA